MCRFLVREKETHADKRKTVRLNSAVVGVTLRAWRQSRDLALSVVVIKKNKKRVKWLYWFVSKPEESWVKALSVLSV